METSSKSKPDGSTHPRGSPAAFGVRGFPSAALVSVSPHFPQPLAWWHHYNRGMTSDELAALRRAGRSARESRERLRAAVVSARRAGLTVRAVAQAAGVSTQTVQRWTREDTQDD